VPWLTGCIPSVNPIYTDEDVIFDPALLGIYPDSRYKENFTIIEQFSDPCCYRIIQKEGQAEYRMVGRLIKLGDQRFMDLTPEEPLQGNMSGVIGGTDILQSLTWLPLHIFVKITADTSGPRFTLMDEKGFLNLTRKDPTALKVMNERLIVSSTVELQSFLKKYGNDKEVFNQEGFLRNRLAKLPASLDSKDYTRLTSGGLFQPSTNGEAAYIDLKTGTIGWPGQGHLIVQCWVGPKGPKPLERFDWKCRLTVPAGGLIEFTNQLEITAPESGYRAVDEVDMPASLGSNWRFGMSKNYFLKLADGKYARIEFSFTPSNQQSVRIVSLINNSGQRHLDAGYRKQKVFE
jgi:hypothetical protein